jgi:hypothetical protein
MKRLFTCDTLQTGVSISHGSILFMHVRATSSYGLEYDMIVLTFCTIVILMLNLIIYSSKSSDVKENAKIVGK